jgi:hypothetical protein
MNTAANSDVITNNNIKKQSDLADVVIHWTTIFNEHLKEEKCECKFRDVIKECLDSDV